MADAVAQLPGAAPAADGAGWIAFSLAGKRFALPMAAVEAVETPVPVATVPHATPALLGAGNFAGRIMAVVDVAQLLGGRQPGRHYDGRGAILRLRTPKGSIGLWIDQVERLLRAEPAAREEIALIDPVPLLDGALMPPLLASDAAGQLGDVAERVLPVAIAAPAEPFILIEVAEQLFRLPQRAVIELIDAVPWTRMPRAPAALWGIAVLRGTALPVLSLAVLLRRSDRGLPGAFAVIELAGHRALLAVDRIVGLRFGRLSPEAGPSEPSPEEGAVVDVAALIPDETRRIVLGFAATGGIAPSPASGPSGTVADYLAFTVAGQDFAVPAACVDRVIGAQPLIALPRRSNSDGDAASCVVGIIELSGQIVPVAGLQSQLGLVPDGKPPAPDSFIILRGAEGLGAIGVDRVKKVVRLGSDDFSPPPPGNGLIEAVAAPVEGELLRIIAVSHLWGAG